MNIKKISNSVTKTITIIALAIITINVTNAQERPRHQEWSKLCATPEDSQSCNVRYNLLTKQGQLITGVNLITIKGTVNRRIFQVAVPSWRAIAPGIQMQIDDGKENTLAYSFCLPDRCIAEIPLSETLLSALKAGGDLKFVSTNFRNEKNPVSITLSGFTKAYDGEPLERSEFEEQQKKLEQELRKKAEETRKKLKEAQDKAKSGS